MRHHRSPSPQSRRRRTRETEGSSRTDILKILKMVHDPPWRTPKMTATPQTGSSRNDPACIGICWPRRCRQMTAVHSRQPDLLHRPSPRATRPHEGNTHTTVRLLLLRATPMGLRGELSLVPRGLLLFGWGKQVEGGKVPKPCRNAPKPCKNAACPDFPPQHVSPPQPNIIRFELSSLPKKSIKYLRVTTRIEHLGGR